ncbi:MAG: fatty acid desaturase, partial [Gemmatimonadales bacterium]
MSSDPIRSGVSVVDPADPPPRSSAGPSWRKTLSLWFDQGDSVAAALTTPDGPKRVEWLRVIPFIGMHLACLGVFFVQWRLDAVAVAGGLYLVRMFAITGFYHRYFSHRTFRTSRAAQFIFAVLGASATQRGPLWWAAHHRKHHRHSDTELDVHSPRQHGF